MREVDILDENFDGDLDAELAEVDAYLDSKVPEVYLGEIVDTDLKNKIEIYACTEIKLILGKDRYTLVGSILDVGGDELYKMEPLEFGSMEEVVAFLKTKKLHNCPIDLESLLVD